ncbi:MAG: metallophosphoesterase [Dehalococcoidia bacterium]|nr:metallophosphoesterase [Dehalococcoidia bacterium]
MKIGLISDTHIPSMGKEPPPQVARIFEGVDLILHAGDIYIDDCIRWLERIAPVHATSSSRSTVEASPRISSPVVVEAGGHSIGLVHELVMYSLPDDVRPGTIAERYPAGRSISTELEGIFGKPIDIVVFGYTHRAMVESHQGVLFVNPGSPNMVGDVMRIGTVAILDLTPQGPDARIIQLTGAGE